MPKSLMQTEESYLREKAEYALEWLIYIGAEPEEAIRDGVKVWDCHCAEPDCKGFVAWGYPTDLSSNPHTLEELGF